MSFFPRSANEQKTHVDLEHLLKVRDAVDHVVGPLLLDGDTRAVDAAHQLSSLWPQLALEVVESLVQGLLDAVRVGDVGLHVEAAVA